MAVKERESQSKHTIPLHLEIKSENECIHESAPIQEMAKEISDVISKVRIKTPIIARAFNWDALAEFMKYQPYPPGVPAAQGGRW